MAKRRRLTPPGTDYLAQAAAGRAPEARALFPAGPAPIAQVAGDASASAALERLAGEMRAAREGGRLVVALPTQAVAEDWLVRDRLHWDAEEMADLAGSIAGRGQQTPIEVVPTDEEGRYGLISGWRRLQAIRQLHRETGEARFATILAVLRQPASVAEAYRAMVEENEIRVGLSYYERARIVAKTVEAGVHRNPREAVAELFAAASRAKRSKIGSFLAVHEAIGDRLNFGHAIPERLGLALARALERDAGQREVLRERLRKTAPARAEDEVALLSRALKGDVGEGRASAAKQSLKAAAETKKDTPEDTAAESLWAGSPVKGVHMEMRQGPAGLELAISGSRVTPALRDRLFNWLRRL